ncbi:hypothetical protein [Massilia sp. YIM B04103]|uniref:hypothetical protein n=1 Tax=Massilia sp. YIM B04103 TaxID=2963106 RepID=UPI00210A32AC|nr:hypothetical protein [Massilia sp. YIM B04103]
MELTTLALLILIPLLVWRIYLRLKQIFRRQESLAWRHVLGVAVCGALLLALGFSMLPDTGALSFLAAGAVGGGWLAAFSLKRTRFENRGLRFYFTPYPRFGMLVCLLFSAAVLSIGVELYMNSRAAIPQAMSQVTLMRAPARAIAFGLMLGFIGVFSAGLLRWRRTQKPLPDAE